MSSSKETIHPFPGRLEECYQCQKQTDPHDAQFPCLAVRRSDGISALPTDEKGMSVDAVFPVFSRQKGCSSIRPKSS